MRDRPHDEVMVEHYRKDPAYAATLLNSVLDDGDADELQDVLQIMNTAFGDGSGRPKDIASLIATIRAMGLRLSVAPVRPKPRRRTTKKTSVEPVLH